MAILKSTMLLVLLSLCSLSLCGASFARMYRPQHDMRPTSLQGEESLPPPLDLTKVLQEEGSLTARKVAECNLGNLTSYAGFVQTDPVKHMFWWYFPPQNGDPNAPVIVWLQGGPGGSSLFGLFGEMGPFYLTADLELHLREISWNKEYGMIFIDNPVGAGFSYPDNEDGYCNNTKECVASNLYSVLQQFYVMFPEQKKNALYITGESYGGHYVPAISYYIHQRNTGAEQCDPTNPYHAPCATLPFKGMAIGDGWVDPVNQVSGYPDLLYNFGLVSDAVEIGKIKDYCNTTISLIKENKMVEAFNVWDEMLNGDVYPYRSYFYNVTGSDNYDNMLRSVAPEEFSYYAQYVNLPEVRKEIHVGDAVFNSGTECEMNLLADFHVSFVDELVTLLEYGKYTTFLYSGQLDIIIGAPLTEAFLKVMSWSGQTKYLQGPKAIWKVKQSDVEVAGFAKTVDNFSYIIVRGAGHITPYDKPREMMDLIHKMINGGSFFPDSATSTSNK